MEWMQHCKFFPTIEYPFLYCMLETTFFWQSYFIRSDHIFADEIVDNAIRFVLCIIQILKYCVCHAKVVQSYSYFETGCRKNVHATILKGNMEYDWYTVSDDFSCQTYFCCFPLALANTFPRPFGPILSNFFEEQWT